MVIFGFSLTLILVAAAVAVWIWSIVHIISGEFREPNDKIVFLLVVLLFPFVGTIVYLMVGKKRRMERIDEFV
jgi:Zn-dependent protease with chaperone function